MQISNHETTDIQPERNEARQEFDSPWKKVIEVYFPSFIEFFFPQIYDGINWGRGYEFLDKEFQQAVHEAESGACLADKLVKVWTVDGQETWVLMHIEVQNQRQNDFAQRMFVYYYRIYDYYKKKKVAPVAILGDRNANWKPDTFHSQLWDCQMLFQFPIVKLIDYEQQWSMLEDSRNPFAIVTMAHLLAQRTYNNDLNRFSSKLIVIRHLYRRGYERENIINLLIFIDWVLTLPKVLERKICQEIANVEENLKMEYIPSWERIATEDKEEGIALGIEQTRQFALESLKISLEIKFGDKGLLLLPTISQLKSPEELIAFQNKLKTAKGIEELESWCRAHN